MKTRLSQRLLCESQNPKVRFPALERTLALPDNCPLDQISAAHTPAAALEATPAESMIKTDVEGGGGGMATMVATGPWDRPYGKCTALCPFLFYTA